MIWLGFCVRLPFLCCSHFGFTKQFVLALYSRSGGGGRGGGRGQGEGGGGGPSYHLNFGLSKSIYYDV